MDNSFYSLPLSLSDIINRRYHKQCSLPESIAQNIYLLITTHFKECRYDHNYGCSVWENDFDILPNIMWKDEIKASIESVLSAQEKRLTNVKVRIDIEEFEFQNKENIRIKKKLGIKIEGMTVKTNEKFEFQEYIFISPFSLE